MVIGSKLLIPLRRPLSPNHHHQAGSVTSDEFRKIFRLFRALVSYYGEISSQSCLERFGHFCYRQQEANESDSRPLSPTFDMIQPH